MRVFFLIQKVQVRGVEKFICQLAEQLSLLGHETIVCAINPGELTDQRVKIIQSHKRLRFFDLKGLRELAATIKNFDPDIVQANSSDTLKYSVLSRLIFRWRSPIVFRNASIVSRYIRSSIQKYYNRLLYKGVYSVVSVSEFTKRDLITSMSLPRHKIVVIPNAFEELVFKSLAWKEGINIVMVGGFTFEKNHVGMIRIFERFMQRHGNANLWLIGDGILRSQIELEVENKGLNNKVFFTGVVSNPLDYISSADALVLPSIIEGMPGVILESFFCRTPVVAFDVGGVHEIVIPGRTGWLVSDGDEVGFDAALEDCLNGSSAAIIEEAFILAKRHTIENIGKQFEKYYLSIHRE